MHVCVPSYHRKGTTVCIEGRTCEASYICTCVEGVLYLNLKIALVHVCM